MGDTPLVVGGRQVELESRLCPQPARLSRGLLSVQDEPGAVALLTPTSLGRDWLPDCCFPGNHPCRCAATSALPVIGMVLGQAFLTTPAGKKVRETALLGWKFRL